MFDSEADDRSQHLVLHALVSYANSCTLPNLTPSCPFFEDGTDGPSCHEQCRSIIEDQSGLASQVASHVLGGLRITGRELPSSVVAGGGSFDAAQVYLEDKDLPVVRQRTSSLMLSLRSNVVRRVLRTSVVSEFEPIDYWGELLRRGVAMDRVGAGGLARAVAGAIALRTVMDRLAHAGHGPEATAEGFEPSPWTAVLAASFADEQDEVNAGRRRPSSASIPMSRVFEAMGLADELEQDLLQDPVIAYALSTRFMDRVATWLSLQIIDDLANALAFVAPPTSVFRALVPSARVDEAGLWLWERFTITSLDEWTQSSLLLEWKWLDEGRSDLCDTRVLRERDLDETAVGRRALRRASGTQLRKNRETGIDASMFVDRAKNLLVNGQIAEATQIFADLVELRPGDSEAWNNYGFCMIALDAPTALDALRREWSPA